MIKLEKLTNLQRFLIILVALTGALLALVGKVELTRSVSSPIVLATAPVDPRSLFQGDYVVLRYEISTLTANLLAPESSTFIPEGSAVFVVLRQDADGPLWRPVRVSQRLPELEEGERVIRGTVENGGMPLRVRYGIESFFVPEDQGRWMEQISDRSRVTVRALVTEDGTASMDVLLVDGQEVFSPAGL